MEHVYSYILSCPDLNKEFSLYHSISLIKGEILGGRPPWMPTDHNPKDLEMSSKALYQQFNPNDPQIDQSMLLFHNKFGILKSLLRCSFPGGEMQSFGLQSAARLDKHRMLEARIYIVFPHLSASTLSSMLAWFMTCQCFLSSAISILLSGFWPYPLSLLGLAFSALVCLDFAFPLLPSVISFSWPGLYLAFAHVQIISTSLCVPLPRCLHFTHALASC